MNLKSKFELNDRLIKIMHSKEQRGKIKRTSEVVFKCTNICANGIPEKENEKGEEKIFEEHFNYNVPESGSLCLYPVFVFIGLLNLLGI